jgi:hypothetical protein
MYRLYLFPEGLYTNSIPDSYATLQNELVVVDVIIICLPSHCTRGFWQYFLLFSGQSGCSSGLERKKAHKERETLRKYMDVAQQIRNNSCHVIVFTKKTFYEVQLVGLAEEFLIYIYLSENDGLSQEVRKRNLDLP